MNKYCVKTDVVCRLVPPKQTISGFWKASLTFSEPPSNDLYVLLKLQGNPYIKSREPLMFLPADEQYWVWNNLKLFSEFSWF